MDGLDASLKILYIRSGGAWVPIGCLTSNSIGEETQFINTTTRVSGGWETALPSNQTYTIEADAFSTRKPGVLSYKDLLVLKRSRSLLEWKLEDDVDRETGFAYIAEISEEAEAGGLVVFSIVLVGQGVPTQGDAVEPEPEDFVDAPFLSISSVSVLGIMIAFNLPDSTNDIAYFNIYRNDVLYDTLPISFQASNLKYTDAAVVPGETYSYNVQAVDINGLAGPLSNKIINTVEVPDDGLNYIIYEDNGVSPPGGGFPLMSLLLGEDGASIAYED